MFSAGHLCYLVAFATEKTLGLWWKGAQPPQESLLTFSVFSADDQYWAVSGYSIEPGFPKPIQNLGFPTSVGKIDAAVHDQNTKKTYFFVGNKYWR